MNKFINRVAGRFTLIKKKIGTEEIVQQVGPFDNLITDIGLNRIGTSPAMTYCAVGSGTSTPAVTDTTLQGFVGRTSTIVSQVQTNLSESPYWAEASTTYRFAPGVATGNLNEIGVGWDDGDGFFVWSRARIVDALGNPTTITILEDEFLEAIYTLRYYPPLNTISYVVNINGVDYTFQTRVADVGTTKLTPAHAMAGATHITGYGGASTQLGPVTQSISNYDDYQAMGGGSPVEYVNNSKKRVTVSTTDIDTANFVGGIKGLQVLVATYASLLSVTFQSIITPPIPKTSDVGLTLNFSFSWDRYTP